MKIYLLFFWDLFELNNIKNDSKKEFIQKYQYDIITGMTNIGCHRDDIEFKLDNFYAKTHSSQGEMRTIVLAVKLALIEFVNEYRSEYPVLLLDDVLSELDESRQQNLMKYIQSKTQTFITSTNINEINLDEIKDIEEKIKLAMGVSNVMVMDSSEISESDMSDDSDMDS